MKKCYYHAVMFDFDGTLVDTMHEYADIAADEISKRYHLQVQIARQLYLETSGIPFFQQLESIFGSDPKNDECAKRFEERKARYLENVTLNREAIGIIDRIRSLGVSIAITSNNFQELLDQFVKKSPKLFDLVLGFGNGFSKGPTQFTRVIDSFGVDRRYMLFVGDSLSDMRKGLAFGIDSVAVSGTLKAEAFTSVFKDVPVISTLTDLEPILIKNKPVIN